MRKYHYDHVANMAARALARGGVRKTPLITGWDISGNCSDPYLTEIVGERERGDPTTPHSIVVELETRCRRCENCRKHRANLWRARASAEVRNSLRTWFGTLTMRPDAHMLMKFRACVQAPDFEARSEEERFKLLCAQHGRELTLFLKRVRKESRAPLRYIAVAEKHTKQLAGLPHLHILLHEQSSIFTAKKEMLQRQWEWGFTNFKLLDGEAEERKRVNYVCKYIAKEAGARVRASMRYGATNDLTADQQIAVIAREFGLPKREETAPLKTRKF